MPLSNSDMDELFRDAAEKYPLKTDNADWDKVARALDAAETEKPGAFVWGRVAGIVLLLIVLSGTAFYFFNDRNEKTITDAKIVAPKLITKTSEAPALVQKEIGKNALINNNSPIEHPSTVNEKTVNNKRSVPGKMSASGGTSQPADLSLITHNSKADQVNKNAATVNEEKNTAAVNKITEITTVEKESAKNQLAVPIEEKRSVIAEEQNAQKKTVNAESAATAKIQAVNKQNRFYITALAGIDESHVALQQFSKAGFSVGVSAGYNISSHLSIEAGVLSSSKQYYTGAQYFNTAKLGYPSTVKWNYFEGECRMLEIPVLIRYNFTAQPRSQWFLTSGLSSYLMHKEDYDYEYENYGQTKTGSHSYTNASKNWFSTIHVSGGVETKIFQGSFLRIEPYIRVPIKKMGYGELPISSAGLNIGFRHNIF